MGLDVRTSAFISGCGPTSLVAAEIHPGPMPAGICDGWLHRNIQVACHPRWQELYLYYNCLCRINGTAKHPAPSNFGQCAEKLDRYQLLPNFTSAGLLAANREGCEVASDVFGIEGWPGEGADGIGSANRLCRRPQSLIVKIGPEHRVRGLKRIISACPQHTI